MTDIYSTLLALSIFIPLICGVLLFAGRRLDSSTIKLIAMIGFISPAIISVILWINFSGAERGAGDYAYLNSGWDLGLKESFGISLQLGLNGISLPLYVLSGIVGMAAGLHAMQSKAERLSSYLLLLLIMHGGLMGVFASVDIFFFYFFHELALIPTFIMIGIWGGQNRRSAAMEMTIYLTLGAMLSLVGLIALNASSDWDAGFNLIALREYFSSYALETEKQGPIFGLLLIGFGILVSLFPFHSWAPRGYAAAPTGAAMLHSGVLKKFGLYGLLQIAVPLLPEGLDAWSQLIIWLALGNIVLLGLVTMAQRDLKQLIGYSSVMHMGYCFLGIVTVSVAGIGGTVILMFAHGLSVALMFMLATSVFNRTHTYDFSQMGGLVKKAPVLTAFFVAATMAGIGLPGFANFWGEFTIFVALWDVSKWATVIAVSGVVISAIYGLRAVAKIFFGPESENLKNIDGTQSIGDIEIGEKIPACILLIALLIVGFWPKSISDNLNQTLISNGDFQDSIPAEQVVTPMARNSTSLKH